MTSVIEITDKEFESELAKATQPVLLYFWAKWCGPCRLTAPLINGLADQYSDRLIVMKLEVDVNPEAVKEYKVEGVPAFRLLKDGKILLSCEGAITKQKLASLIEPLL